MDSSESPVHGQQEGAAYNGHFECVCYHPLFLFNQFGDCEGAKLRSGNVHSADDWQEVLDPVVERYFTAAVRLLFRADAAFAKPEIYEYLETRQIDYAIRLPANEVLQRKIAHLLTRPTEGPSPKPIVSYHDFTYQAQSWNVSQMNTRWVERAMAHTLHQRVILDMDSSESPVHGQQEGAAYNGHFECVCYHPLFLFNQFGDCEGAKLRSGNVHSADDWQEVLDPVVERYFTAAVRLLFRADAAFAKPEIYEYLETRQIDYAIRLPANEVLQRKIAHLLTRPTEGPSPKPIVSYHDFTEKNQAQSWNVSRRVVAKSLP